MLKKDLEKLNNELVDKLNKVNSKLFDVERDLFQEKVFVELGDAKLLKWINKYDALLVDFKKLKGI